MSAETVKLEHGDALIVVDVQNDFLPGGTLAVPCGDQVVAVLNRYIERFQSAGLPVYATRDWHPPEHCSFQRQGGPWPAHCMADTDGAAFAPELNLPDTIEIVSKATARDKEAYSGFQGTGLTEMLHGKGVRRVFVGGLATDYCVLNTVLDALNEGFEVFLLTDAIRAVDVNPGDGDQATEKMTDSGAIPTELKSIR